MRLRMGAAVLLGLWLAAPAAEAATYKDKTGAELLASCQGKTKPARAMCEDVVLTVEAAAVLNDPPCTDPAYRGVRRPLSDAQIADQLRHGRAFVIAWLRTHPKDRRLQPLYAADKAMRKAWKCTAEPAKW